MICGYEILHIICCEVVHGLFAISWCLLPVLVLSWILTTCYTRYSVGETMGATLWATLSLLAISCLVVGLSFLSHVFADTHELGF